MPQIKKIIRIVTVTELSKVKYHAKNDDISDNLKILAIFLTEKQNIKSIHMYKQMLYRI